MDRPFAGSTRWPVHGSSTVNGSTDVGAGSIDQVIELGFDLAGHVGGSAATGAVQEAAGAFLSKALDPFSQGGVGELEGIRDGFDGVPGGDLTDGLSPAKHTDFLGVLH